MKITDQVVKDIADLAQLQVRDSDLAPLSSAMQTILDLADQMQTVNTEGVMPMANPLDATQPLRPDLVTESDQRDHFQSIAPSTEDGLYLVPRVVE